MDPGTLTQLIGKYKDFLHIDQDSKISQRVRRCDSLGEDQHSHFLLNF